MRETWVALVLLMFGLYVSTGVAVAQVPLYAQDNVLVGANFNDGPGSSDMTLIMRLVGDDDIYVDEGHAVKYIHDPDNQDIGDDWIQIEFDDSDWKDGFSGVGFSDGDDNTQVPAGRISIWTRYYFDAPSGRSISNLVLFIDYDDQCIAWLNGVKVVASAGAPEGDPPAWNASQGGLPNHGSSEMPAGKPNKNRAYQQQIPIDFNFVGGTPFAVEPQNKLSILWAHLKRL